MIKRFMTLCEKCERWKLITRAVLGLIVLASIMLIMLRIFVPRLFVPVEPTVTSYDGIDVSKHNGAIDWEEVATSKNIKFVYVKATEGRSIIDRRYHENLRGAKEQGMLVGSYHFFSSKSSIREQFENFKCTAITDEQDLIPVLDVEPSSIKGRWTVNQLQDSVALFVSLVKEHYGRLPIIYSNEGFYKRYLAPKFNNHLLFIANYNCRPTLKHTRHNLWQYTERGRVKGIAGYVDLIMLDNGTQLDRLRLR